jgi:hypothetical protein
VDDDDRNVPCRVLRPSRLADWRHARISVPLTIALLLLSPPPRCWTQTLEGRSTPELERQSAELERQRRAEEEAEERKTVQKLRQHRHVAVADDHEFRDELEDDLGAEFPEELDAQPEDD